MSGHYLFRAKDSESDEKLKGVEERKRRPETGDWRLETGDRQTNYIFIPIMVISST
ncbi:MAG: hypothetical protein JXN62_00300 [Bacteroidales bacterium]|nr:hypothetical protein [Bacteroidales bacterium]